MTWFEQYKTYESLNKPGEIVTVEQTWASAGVDYAAGQWVLGPRTGESWSRRDVDDIFDRYEEVNPHGIPSSECDAGTCDCADCQCEGPCDCGTVKEEIIPQSAFSFRGPETIDMTSMSDKATRLIQIGGAHYVKYAIQPFDIIDCYGLSFYEGSALKYLLRHRDKNGVEDLKKARHYLDVLIAKAEVSNDAD